MNYFVNTKLLILALTCGVSGLAQTDPPTLIRMVRNITRASLRDSSVRQYVDSKAPVTMIGMSSISGLSETWLMELHDSFGNIENVDTALAAVPGGPAAPTGEPVGDEVLSASRTVVGLYRPALSYRPEEASKAFPRSRYFLVSVYRIRPGTDADFLELVRLRRARYDSVNLDRPEMAYQVISGAASGTFLFLTPLATLKVLDDALAKMPNYAEGVRETSTTTGKKIASDVELSQEHLIFRIDPSLSYVSDDFAAADPDFWTSRRVNQQ